MFEDKIKSIENYVNGKLEGLRSVFYPNGKVAEEVNYKNNSKYGLCKIYAQNGVVIEESNYANNNYNGISIFKDTHNLIIYTFFRFQVLAFFVSLICTLIASSFQLALVKYECYVWRTIVETEFKEVFQLFL